MDSLLQIFSSVFQFVQQILNVFTGSPVFGLFIWLPIIFAVVNLFFISRKGD